FTIANPPAGAVENSDNDSLATATPLPLVESPVGSGFYTAFGVGTFASTSDVDYWRIDAEAGDRLSLQLEADARGVYPQVYIQNPAGQNLAGYGGDNNGRVGFQNFTFGTPGTYYLRVYSNNRSAHYGMRLDLSRGPYLENEGNDSQASANIVPFTVSAGLYQAKVAGGLSSSDPAGDYFQLGTLNAGNVISLSTHFPTGSALAAGRIVLTVELAGNPMALVTNTSGTLNFNSPSNGIYYVHIQAPVADLRNQYEMDIAISDSVAPQVTAVSLPAEGTTTTALIDRFTASFSEDLGVLSATNQANYELRGAGVDGNFGTADDTLYDVSSSGYTTGLVVSYSVSDGPLQAGKYRFTLRTGTADRAGNSLATPYVRNFNVGPVPGFVTENRSDDVGGLATSLSASPSVVGNGTFGYLTGYGTGANPYFLVAGRLDTDTAPDLAVANGSSGSVSILLNDGSGNFNNTTNIATGALPVALALADFNRDGTNDLAVANYNAGTVSVLFGLNKGNFQSSSNYPGFSNPNGLVAGDLNGDGRPDLAVANFGNNTIQILLDNANGTFSPSTNFAAGSGPVWVAVGDLNHDGKADLAVANYYASTISIFMGVGDGSFTLKTNLPCGSNPRFTVITDVSGDGNTDLVVNESGANQVGVWLGNGDGTFANPQHYLSALSDSRQLVVVDVNGDSKPDLVVPGYANNRFSVFLNTGAGLFADADAYGAGSNPIAVAAADFNADGRVDLAFANYNGGGISIWSGNGASPLTEDPAGSGLFTGVGRGIRSSSDDVDFYQFSGKAGDSAVLAVETPGNPPTSSLYYQVLNLDGGVLLSFGADNFGYAESGVFTLPRTGTYLVRVAANQDYQGEYRIRMTLARPPLQLVNEANGGIDQARSLTLSRTNSNHLKASVAGYIGVSDQNGDYYTLGDLPAGTTLALTLTEPSTSGLAAVLAVIDAAGNVVTNSAAGAASFSFTVPAGKGGSYYARVTAAPGGFTGTSETALYFNGAAGTDLGPWFNNQTFTLSMWVNPAASQNTYADILDNNHNSTVGWVIQQDVGNNNHYIFGSADGSSGVPFVLAANTWQNLTVTRDSTNINRVYINGVLAGSAAGTGQINYDGNQFLRIGRWGGGGRNWNGTFDELRIWNRMLTPAEITAGLTGSLVGNEAGLLGYWRFNEGAGTVSTDLTSAHHDAQLGSGTSWSFLAPNSAIPQGLLSQYILGIDLSGSTAPAVLADTLPGQGVNSTNIITEFNVSFSTEVDKEFARLSRDVRKFGGHSYFVTDSSSDWATAEGRAVAAGGHLVDITSAAENSWIFQNFNPYGDLWIGLRYASGGAGFAWSSGIPFSYSNWNGGEPNNAGTFESAAEMVGGGGWVDIDASPARYGVIEIASSTDTDGDGLVNAIDPYPNDPLNAFDLRAAGPDGNFDTGDDVVYRIVAGSYAGGLTARFSVVDGPLQPGNYRFKVTTALRDRLGNTLAAPYVHTFTVSSLPGFVQENRGGPLFPGNTSIAGSTSNRLDGSFTGLATFGVGRNPYFVTSGRFNQDTNLDVVSANYSDGNISILLGDGTGQLIASTNISTGGGAISVAKGDFNGDGKLDLAVANYTGNTISILLGAGDGSFAVSSTLTGFSNPVNLAAVDVDKDNKLDLIVPNAGNSTVVIWKGDGAGGFTSGASVPIPNQPWTVVSGDFDKDTKVDFAVASVSSQSTFVVLGNGDGTFKTPQSIQMAVDIRAITAGDLDGDGNLDLVTGGPGARLSVLMGVGDGTFLAPVTYDVGLSDTYQVVLSDVDGNGTLDVVVPSYGNSRLVTVLNDGTGHLGGTTSYAVGGNPISLSMGDFNSDSRLDIVTANYSGQSVSIYLGNDRELLNLDGAGTGLRIAAGRGSLSDINDADYWTFSASAGDRVAIAAEVPGDPSNTSLHYIVYRPDGSTFFDFYGDNQGRAQGQGIAPSSGTYSLRVEYNNQYFGEYRFRVTLASPPVQLESEDNSSLGNADALTYDINAGVQSASVLGYLSRADGAGDYFALGNLAVATKIDLKSARPATSALYPVLEIYSSDGTLVTNGVPGGTNLSFVIPDGEEGAYFAHVTGSYGARSATATNALYFNGANNYVNTGAWTPGTQWSVQAWVQAASLPGGRRVVAGGFGACRDWGLVLQDGRWGTAFRQPGGCSTTLTSPIVPIPGVWYHVASISDGTNAFLYVNGVLQGTAPVEPNYSAYEGGTFIGADICCGEYFPGVIQDVSIWGKPLSQAQVSAFMAQSPLGSEQGLAGYWRLNEGSGNTSTDLSPNGHNGTFVNGPTWIRTAPVGALPSGIMQQYLLSISLTDTVPPQVVSVSSPIPDEGSSTPALVDRFSLSFSGDMSTPTVTNAATYELRGAGPDNTFGNADDVIYSVVNTPAYTTGTQASYQVLNAPLQVGKYRLTVKTTLANRSGTPLASAYVRNFTVANLPGFVLEGRFDDAFNQAVSFSTTPSSQANGTVTRSNGFATGNNPYFLATGQLNGGNNLDLVVANYGNGTVSVLLNQTNGSFVRLTNYVTGAGAIAPILGKFDADANQDLAVLNYQAGTVSILKGQGDGTFQPVTNYNVGSSPVFGVATDLNSDGKVDLAIAQYSGAKVSVLLGNGDGTFQAPVSYNSGANPGFIAVADFNNDGKPDLIVPNYGADSLTLFVGNGNGTFAAGINIPAGNNPQTLAVADFNGDNKLDLAVGYGAESRISVYLGNGNASFQPRFNLDSPSSSSYQVIGADINGDGLVDIIATGYYSSSVVIYRNKGGAVFEPAATYGTGSNPVGLVAGDWNGDGRLDLATADYNAGGISVFLGNDTELLGLDAGTGMRIGAGRGVLSTSGDADYWQFDASAGDGIAIAAENPGSPAASGLHFIIYRPGGATFTDFYQDYYGRGQGGGVAPVSGTYTVRVEPNYNYTGEYRLRVSLLPAGVQLEAEDNGTTGNANVLNLATTAGHRQGKVFGYVGLGDGGDYFRLGTASVGAAINLSLAQPASSGLLGSMGIVDSGGNLVAYSPGAVSSLSYTIPAGGDGVYYARVVDMGPYPARSFGGTGGFAVRLDGGSDYLSVASGPVPASGDFTFECWAFAAYSSSYREIVSQGTGGNAFYLGTDGTNIRVGDSWSNTTIPFPFTGWHHFAVVKSASDTLLLIDGVQVAALGHAIANPSATELRFGRQYGPYSEYWPGGIDEVRIWNTARTTNVLSQNMTNRLTGSEAGLVGYWRFDEGAGTVVHDATTNGHDAQFQGHPFWLPQGKPNVQPAGIFSQYVLAVDVNDTTPPAVTSVTLPAAGTTATGIYTGFTLNFSKDLDPTINALNRFIRVNTGHAYTLTDSTLGWADAETQAKAVGGHLVTVNDASENAWINTTFTGLGNLWIGFTDEAQKGTWVWSSGQAAIYTNWANGSPDNSGNRDYAYLQTDGKWNTSTGNGNFRGVIEVSGADTDGDGIADTLDPYPNDPLNVFDLRATGPDGQFDTGDDQVYRLATGGYTSGGSLDFSVTDGPLQPGNYRFTVTSSLKDRFGNGLGTPFTQFFTIGTTLGYTGESRANDSQAAATPITLAEDIPGMRTGGGRGALSTGPDVDYWSFTGKAGDLFLLSAITVGNPGASGLHYIVYRPDGSQVTDFYGAYNGDGQSTPVTLPVDGSYAVGVFHNYGYTGEYRIRVTMATPPLAMEAEENGTLATATSVGLSVNGNALSGGILGAARTASDLDYFKLGTVTNGSSIVLTVRR
ncbi:MAG TPA: FG-GAP-like repeat-containing protein, partial [Candidatus Limnocylindria bacterium]|nr:FG-GAP-like repeat-containing protein [Candidatus Limnocylindria bacterium]